ncbi:hypothetical protein RFI_07613 [Reticulomyxa filosa]|uniref:Uncharacterized protein n=1 Tax=Reticulomyxa filosa TaxID=46433 RepID=X6NUA2_RETFI|nr:hypothetical protein RFI_07613 [Reticulomyxa filosa]|eukprot:ETO29503.1 hypothetical protein RFI_07613 [Reticulomyxa filosa]
MEAVQSQRSPRKKQEEPLIPQTKVEGEKDMDIIDAPVTKLNASPLSEQVSVVNVANGEQKEALAATQSPEKPHLKDLDIIDCLKCVFSEIDNERLFKWKGDLRKQDIYTLHDLVILESESMSLLSTHLSVKCYDCLLKLRNKCWYLFVCVNKFNTNGQANSERLNGIYVHMPTQDIYENMPLFRQISLNRSDQIKSKPVNSFCIYYKNRKWKMCSDSQDTRDKSHALLYSEDDILGHKKSRWMYYSIQEKVFKPYESKQFGGDIIVDSIMR